MCWDVRLLLNDMIVSCFGVFLLTICASKYIILVCFLLKINYYFFSWRLFILYLV